jgi:hypothetical protein
MACMHGFQHSRTRCHVNSHDVCVVRNAKELSDVAATPCMHAMHMSVSWCATLDTPQPRHLLCYSQNTE